MPHSSTVMIATISESTVSALEQGTKFCPENQGSMHDNPMYITYFHDFPNGFRWICQREVPSKTLATRAPLLRILRAIYTEPFIQDIGGGAPILFYQYIPEWGGCVALCNFGVCQTYTSIVQAWSNKNGGLHHGILFFEGQIMAALIIKHSYG